MSFQIHLNSKNADSYNNNSISDCSSGCVSIQGSVGINRSLWYCLAGDRDVLISKETSVSVLVRSYSGHLVTLWKAAWGFVHPVYAGATRK